ncbi:DUF802 domain-containing protein [Alloalcanivorax sp. C16-2]|uniref:DUF802 domain-containing protein n=1 Tax=Alloalcanivorax sp. C16-2 TaxID=3390052 RepID=UPI00397066D9
MTRFLFVLAFILGAAAVLWVGLGFLAGQPVALLATLLIALVYGFGFLELLRFRRATDRLSENLTSTPSDEQALGGWLASLPADLRGAVRRRIEGEAVALPGPMLTPYLSGLLVMLGLLGTFIGMTVTLQGAVTALDGGADLQAIQGALAAPIAGLSLAFGTSIAGVAASAMLGLAATLCRRDRTLAGRELDGKISRELRVFSLKQQQRDAFQALRAQSDAFPAVVEQLAALTDRLDALGGRLADNLSDNQERFHSRMTEEYRTLADTLGERLQHHLGDSARLAAEGVKPVMEDAMARLQEQTERTHHRLGEVTERHLTGLGEQWRQGLAESRQAHEQQLAALSERFQDTTRQAADAWSDGLAQQNRQQAETTERLAGTLEDTAERLRADNSAMIEHGRQQQAEHAARVEEQLARTTEAFQASTEQAAGQWRDHLEQQGHAAGELVARLDQALARHGEAFRATAGELLDGQRQSQDTQRQQAGELLRDVGATLQGHQDGFQQAVRQLLDGQRQGLEQLTARTGEQLAALRDQEQARGEAASQRLAELEATASRHLTELGTALEAPMTRLIETASETPKAAAEVINELRAEMTRNSERDNALLEERQRLVSELDRLLGAQRQAAEAQREAVESLIVDAGGALRAVSDTFTDQVERQSTQLETLAGDLTGGAREMASLGEAFGAAVARFGEANEGLLDTLQQVEGALTRSAERSDEQLAYYVEQAREVIDLSLSAQKDVIDALGRVRDSSTGAS